MKKLLWAVPAIVVVCLVLFAGRDDIRRIRQMHRM